MYGLLISLFLLVSTVLVNLLVAYVENAMDREIKEDQDLTI